MKIANLIQALSSAQAEIGNVEVLTGLNKTPIAGVVSGQLLPKGHLPAAPIFPDEATTIVVLLSPSECPDQDSDSLVPNTGGNPRERSAAK